MDFTVLELGKAIANGLAIEACKMVFVGCVFVLCVTIVRNSIGIGMDNSDKSSWNRSGLKIYTDHKTGVQYVATRNGLTVRVDANGKPLLTSD